MQKQLIAVISSDEKAFNHYMLHTPKADRAKYVWVHDMAHCEGKTFTRVTRTCLWFGRDLLEYCESHLRTYRPPAFQSVDHDFGSPNVRSDFLVTDTGACVLLVLCPMGGTQRVELSPDDVRRMADAVSSM